ncbi:MAG: hypothetical protein N2Z80_06180 [Hydrogenothermaceae bacterium]|nr:hypothetical protein [Hydrogenothermaceae bacterium]
MFKFIFLILLINLSSYGEDNLAKYEAKIIEKIVVDITGKSNPKICVIDYPSSYIQQYALSLILTNCTQADFIISSSDKRSDYNKPILVVGSTEFSSHDVVGVVFWKKGRPQVLFINKNIRKFDIQLPEEYRKYIIRKEGTLNVKSDS